MFHLHLSDAMTGRPGSGIASNPKSSSIPFKTGSVPAAMWQVVATCMLFLSFVAGCSHIFSPNEMGEIYAKVPRCTRVSECLMIGMTMLRGYKRCWMKQKELPILGFKGMHSGVPYLPSLLHHKLPSMTQQIEALLKKPPENNSSQSNTALTDVISKLQNVTPLSTLPNNVTASPLDTFRDRLALREEIRLERIQTELDDRHDLNGNTTTASPLTQWSGQPRRTSTHGQLCEQGLMLPITRNTTQGFMKSGDNIWKNSFPKFTRAF